MNLSRGTPRIFDNWYYDTADPPMATDPTSPSVTITDSNGATVVTAVPTLVGTGHAQYTFTPAANAPLGPWLIEWGGTVNDVPSFSAEAFQVSPSSTSPRLGPCSDWTTTDALACGLDLEDPTVVAAAAEAIEVVSSVLYHLSQGRFPGLCTAREVLCSHRAPCASFWGLLPGGGPSWDASGWGYDYSYGGGELGGLGGGYGGYDFGWGTNGCMGRTPCDCTRPERVLLPFRPVSEVTEVVVDGVTVDPATYRVHDSWLYRCDGNVWPSCSDRCSESSGLTAEWAYGASPPPEGVRAAKVFVCELAKLDPRVNQAGQCRLPQRVTNVTRQGTSWTLKDLAVLLKDGSTGLYEVDLFLKLFGTAPSTITWPESVERLHFGERSKARW